MPDLLKLMHPNFREEAEKDTFKEFGSTYFPQVTSPNVLTPQRTDWAIKRQNRWSVSSWTQVREKKHRAWESTLKKWQLQCIATWGHPTSRQSFWALIIRPVMLQSTSCTARMICRHSLSIYQRFGHSTAHAQKLWSWTFVCIGCHVDKNSVSNFREIKRPSA